MSSEHTPIIHQGYRDKAAEVRAAAKTMGEPARTVLLRLAASYEALADRAAYVLPARAAD